VSVLEQGWNDETRNRFRLILHVIIIVTSVVPPELPMELSLAVTNSVADLMRRCNVYCTEPYRIPWAGQVDTCCFDKTGTLTSDEMQLRGVRLFGSNSGFVDPREEQIPWSTVRVMAGCNALALRNKRTKQRTLIKEVIGDPLEKAVLSGTGYTLHNSNFVLNENQESGNPRALIIHHRFAFSSRLKRMTVLLTEDSDRTVWAVTKGAPETLKHFLTPESLPLDYDEVAEHHMGLGQRVLAMAYRNLGNTVEPKEESRDAVERNLTFCGFLILDCPLKADSKSVITELRKSGHNVVMITGDALLTAAEIARQVGITTKGITYELRAKKRDGAAEVSSSDVMSSFHFVPVGSKAGTGDGAIALSPTNLKTLTELAARSEASFCVSGSVLGQLAQVASTHSQDAGEDVEFSASDENNMMLHPSAQAILRDLVPIISVFARHAPRQKEAIVAAFNLGGCHTLMCGDGTNDVGALKRAHVGISIISAPELEEKHREANATLASIRADQKRERKGKKEGKPKKDKRAAQAYAFQESMRQLQEAQEELDHVELGDASVASPFTSRAMSIRCCKDVLQQGRCTLVTMLQIYKILGVNCLVNALVLTKLHMHGVKQGDRQLTILGIAVAALFFFVSRGKPLPTLSTHRPPSSVLCPQALLSIAIQFSVHYSFIMIATDIAVTFVDPYDPSIIPDARFNPNVLNTCTFLLTMLAAVNTFAVNYRGRPFMEDLSENKLLLRSLQACYFVLLICVTEVFPPLNDLFQLSPFPDTTMNANSADDDWVVSISQAGGLTSFVSQIGFSTAMCMFMVADTALAFGVEKIIVRMSEGPP
jgi:manganese-transporting P-type ATPase